MIGEMRAIAIRVAVESRFPQSGSRKPDEIIVAGLIRHVHHYNDVIRRALFVSAMESEHLGTIVKMKDVDILTAQPPRHA
jgi:hypothetical protein